MQPERSLRELNLLVALTLISEKVRFWSDPQLGVRGEELPPRCMDPKRLAELRLSLMEINEHCTSAGLQAEPSAKG